MYILKIQNFNYSTSSESSRSWRVLQGIVSSVSEGTIKACGFNRSAIGIGMEVVIELSRKSGSQPFVHGVVLNLENQGRIGIILLGYNFSAMFIVMVREVTIIEDLYLTYNKIRQVIKVHPLILQYSLNV